MRILVTGGAGYIGSHTCLELLNCGHQVVVVDNLSNSSSEALKRVEQLTGQSIAFYQADIRDEEALSAVFSAEHIDAVIHFAGSKAVGESVAKPLFYYENNVSASGLLMQVMLKHQVKTLVFSSSATVYGEPVSSPIREDFAVHPESPYGRSKLMVEQMMSDLVVAQPEFSAIVLRYFNPVGAHESGQIGEDPNGIPNNLMPFINQVAIGRRPHLSVFGDDYDTPDGTGVRDYIHVCDLASGHVKALENLHQTAGFHVFNLGTGKGVSVLEMVEAYRRISGQLIAYQVVPRRAGDIGCYYGDPSLAAEKLNWKAERGLDQMVADSWNWQKLNPHGYTRRS